MNYPITLMKCLISLIKWQLKKPDTAPSNTGRQLTDYEYSNSDYVLLSLLVKRVSGMPLASFTRREFFEPLRMTHSWFGAEQDQKQEFAIGYSLRNGSVLPVDPLPSTGDGGMYSSVSDLLRWIQEMQRRGRGRGEPLRDIQIRARLKCGKVLPHASGLFWGRYRGQLTLSHNGEVSGFQSDVVHFSNNHLSVVCLCNRGDVDAASLSRRIADTYLLPERSEGKAQRTTDRAPLSADWAGKWRSGQGFVLSTKIDGIRLWASFAGQTYTMSGSSNRSVLTAESWSVPSFIAFPRS